MFDSSILQGRKPELFFEHGGKFPLIGVADLSGDLRNRTLGCRKKPGRFLHADFPQPGGDILPVYASEVVF